MRSLLFTLRPGLGCRRRWLLATALAGVLGTALALPAPKQRVVLSLSGHITHRNAGAQADFDLEMLEALPQHSFTTQTPWDKTPRKFTGPLLRDVLEAAGAQGQVLHAVALNDYKVDIPAQDAQQFDVIVAHHIDDQPMRVRDRGPLFIVYPYDTDPVLRNGRFFSRSIWQLRRLDVQ